MTFTSLRIAASVALLALSGQAFAQAYDGPYFELPVPCDQTWQGATQDDASIDFTLRTSQWDLPVVASTSGTISSIHNEGTRHYPSYTVVLSHDNGWRTVYGGLKSVEPGYRVGSSIAFARRLGTAGKVSPTMAYLFFATEQYDASMPVYIKGDRPTFRTRLHRAKRSLRHTLDERIGCEVRRLYLFEAPRCDRMVESVFARLHLAQISKFE